MRRFVAVALIVVVCSVVSWSQPLAEAEEHNRRGLILFKDNNWTGAEAEYRKGLSILQAIGRDGMPQYTAMLTNLGVALQSQGRIAEARKALEECIDIETTKLGNRGTTLASALNSLALMEKTEMEFGKSVTLLKRALALKYVDEKTRASTLHNLGSTYFEMGQRSKAEQMFEAAVSEYERLDATAELSPALTYLAKIAAGKSDFARAESLLNRAFEARIKAFGPEHLYVAMTLSDLGTFETERGRHDEAVAHFERALQIAEPVVGKDHLFIAPVLYNYAEVKRKQDRYSEALALYERTIRIIERHYGPEQPRLAAVYTNASRCAAKLKRKPEAKEYAQRARAIQDRTIDYGRHAVDISAFLPGK